MGNSPQGSKESDTTEWLSRTNAGETRDAALIPGSGRYLGVGNGKPLQYFCLENSMDRGAWQAILYGFAKSQT